MSFTPKTYSQIPQARVAETVSARGVQRFAATPEVVGRLLDAYSLGGFEIAKLWDFVERRDAVTAGVIGKRKAAVGRLDWQILIQSGLGPAAQKEAQAHAAVLREFYGNLTASSALKRDESGGVGLLAQQILDARGKEFSVHEWIWRLPTGRRPLSAEFVHCPMWWFENRTGRLRYLSQDGAVEGAPMGSGGWLVSVAPAPLMEPTVVCWLFARSALNDWVAFCDRFGMPGMLGRTDAQPGSAEWDALERAVGAFGQDWAAVVNREASIDLVQVESGGLPYPPLVDAMHRTISAIWRGGDLSTLSASQGPGQGASLQGKEAHGLEADDARFVSETLQGAVDRRVIEYHFGEGVAPLAYFQLQAPQTRQIYQEIAVDTLFVELGAPMLKSDLYERYGRRMPSSGDETVGGLALANSRPNAPLARKSPKISGLYGGAGSRGNGPRIARNDPAAVLTLANDQTGVCNEVQSLCKAAEGADSTTRRLE